MIFFQVSLWFISSEGNTENTMWDLYLNEESYLFWGKYMWQWSLCYTIFQPFQFEPEHKKTCGNESHEKEAKPIHASAADLLLIRIGSFG